MSLTSFVATPDFDEYKERFKQHYKMERRDDGVILVQAHTQGGPDSVERRKPPLARADAQDCRRRSSRTKS